MGNTGVPGPSGASSSGFGEREASVTWAEPSVRGGGQPGTPPPLPRTAEESALSMQAHVPRGGRGMGDPSERVGVQSPASPAGRPWARPRPIRAPLPCWPGAELERMGWGLLPPRGARKQERSWRCGLGCSLRSRGQESLCEWAGPPDTEAAGPRVPRAAASLLDSPSGCLAQLPPTGLLGVAPQTHGAMLGGQEPSCWEPGLRGTAWGEAGASQEAAGTASVMPRTSPLSTAGQAPRQPLWGASPPSCLPQRMSRSARSCGNHQASQA